MEYVHDDAKQSIYVIKVNEATGRMKVEENLEKKYDKKQRNKDYNFLFFFYFFRCPCQNKDDNIMSKYLH